MDVGDESEEEPSSLRSRADQPLPQTQSASLSSSSLPSITSFATAFAAPASASSSNSLPDQRPRRPTANLLRPDLATPVWPAERDESDESDESPAPPLLPPPRSIPQPTASASSSSTFPSAIPSTSAAALTSDLRDDERLEMERALAQFRKATMAYKRFLMAGVNKLKQRLRYHRTALETPAMEDANARQRIQAALEEDIEALADLEVTFRNTNARIANLDDEIVTWTSAVRRNYEAILCNNEQPPNPFCRVETPRETLATSASTASGSASSNNIVRPNRRRLEQTNGGENTTEHESSQRRRDRNAPASLSWLDRMARIEGTILIFQKIFQAR